MKLLLTLLGLLPTIIDAIVGIEQAIGSGKGATKKQLVLNVIGAAATAGENSNDKTVAAISALVDNTVSTLNAAGVLIPQTTAAPPAK